MRLSLSVVLSITILFLLMMAGCGSNKISEASSNEASMVETELLNWPWRGITIVSHNEPHLITEKEISELASYGVNFIRLRLSIRKLADRNNLSVENALAETISWTLDKLKTCAAYNIDVLISHSDFPIDPTSELDQKSEDFWNNEQELRNSLKLIGKLVNAFDTCRAVKAYQFFAEPVIQKNNKSLSPEHWNDFFLEIKKEIRKVSNKYIVYSPGPWGKVIGYKDFGKPFDDPAIIYNFHFYEPHAYTHQMIKGRSKLYSYPGVINGSLWNKQRIKNRINIFEQWASENQVRYGLVGEFSAVRWAENHDEYISDVVAALENAGLGWAYFAYNSWPGWDYNLVHDGSMSYKAKNLNVMRNESETLSILKKNWNINQKQ